MNKKVVKIIICILVAQFSLSANAASRNNKEEIHVPIQIKPERMKLLEEIANQNLIANELPYTEESSNLVKEMLDNKDDYINDNNYELNKMSRSLNIPMGVTDGNFEVVYFSPNLTTTLVFVDKLGNPWTIEKQNVTPPSKVLPEVIKSNMMTFSPKKNRGEGNMTLLFKDSNFPIMLEWKISDEKVDYITEIKIDGYGNNSPQDNMLRMYVGGSSVVSKFEENNYSTMLSGNTPLGFSSRTLINDFGQEEEGFKVWASEDDQFLYIRTRHKIFYPPRTDMKTSSDRKTIVYKTQNSPRISVKKDGKVIHLKVK